MTAGAELEAGVCRSCGCTDARACEGGCSWVDPSHTLCSACVVERSELYRLEALLEDLVSVVEECAVACLLGAGRGVLPQRPTPDQVRGALGYMKRMRALLVDKEEG